MKINKEKLEWLIRDRIIEVRGKHKPCTERASYILALDWVLKQLTDNKDLSK